MATEVAPPSPEDTTATGDEDLPRTLPIRVLAKATTQPAVELPAEPTDVDTRNMRVIPHEVATPTEPLKVVTHHANSQHTPPVGIPRRMNRPASTTIKPKLRVLRGLRINAEFQLYDGTNTIGRRDDEPIEIDLTEQEASDRIWASRKHAVIYVEAGELQIEDLHSRNGTFLNRTRLTPGAKRLLQVNDVIQIGTIQMRVTV